MKKLILDGYNVIHKIPELYALLKTDLERARDGLAKYLISWSRQNNFSGQLYIVFDGQSGISKPRGTEPSGVKCVFTPTNQTADDRIIRMVKNEKDPNSITVVSDDNYVLTECKSRGAKVKSVKTFASAPTPKKDGGQKIIGKAEEQDINDFLKKEWGI